MIGEGGVKVEKELVWVGDWEFFLIYDKWE